MGFAEWMGVDAYISREKDRSRYNFVLQDSATATDQGTSEEQEKPQMVLTDKEQLGKMWAKKRKKLKEIEGYILLYSRYMQCLTSREFTDGAIYYWIWMDEKNIGGQTLWTGWQDEACKKKSVVCDRYCLTRSWKSVKRQRKG